MSAGTFALEGRTFATPHAAIWGIDRSDDERLAALVLTASEVRFGDDLVVPDFSPDAANFDLVRSGRCPVLMEHRFSINDMLGAVQTARVEGCVLMCTARFVQGGDADHVWRMLAAGFPLSLSAGYRMRDAEMTGDSPWGGKRYRLTAWELSEVSVVVAGRDPNAFARRATDQDISEALAAREKDASEGGREAVRARLRLDAWARWATPAGIRIAEDLGVDATAMCAALRSEVESQITTLMTGC